MPQTWITEPRDKYHKIELALWAIRKAIDANHIAKIGYEFRALGADVEELIARQRTNEKYKVT